MLWSLIKIFLFVVAVGAAAIGADYLLGVEGGIRIAVAGFEISLNALESVIFVAVFALFVWAAYKIFGLLVAVWKVMNGDDTAMSRYFSRSKEKKGYEALAQGMIALASGEGRTAMAKAEKAEKYLKRPEVTQLLTAQAAEIAGDRKTAEETYRKMIHDEKTRFVGVRGIMKQKLAEGDTETAYKLATKAFAIKPRHSETSDMLLTMQAQRKDWAAARTTLNSKLKHGSMPRDLHKRRDAVLALSQAKTQLDDAENVDAREAAIAANKKSPELVPAAVLAAESYAARGNKKAATRILVKAWATSPHPDLAAAFAAIEPNETPSDRVKRFGALTRSNADHPETKMLLAELNIAAEDFPEARRALGDLFEKDPTVRSAALMAAIEKGSGGDDAVVQGWLTRAVTAPRDSQWVCDNCQNVQAVWTPTCERCEAFDTLTWKRPPEEVSNAASALLPVLLADKRVDDDATGAVIEVDATPASGDSTSA